MTESRPPEETVDSGPDTGPGSHPGSGTVRTRLAVVVGWRPGKGSRAGKVGSLLVAVPDGFELRYLGRVGAGLSDRRLSELAPRLKHMARKTAAVRGVPAPDVAGARWVRPALVGEISYSGVTASGRLLHAAWRGLRPGLTPSHIAAGSSDVPAGPPAQGNGNESDGIPGRP